MKIQKTALAVIVALGFGSVSLSSYAGSLTIENKTKLPSTSIINNGACSTVLGDIGTTQPGQTNVIPESKVNLACIANRTNCTADVYMTNNCNTSGAPKVATAVFDTKKGIKSVTVLDPQYTVSASQFSVTLSGGPAVANK